MNGLSATLPLGFQYAVAAGWVALLLAAAWGAGRLLLRRLLPGPEDGPAAVLEIVLGLGVVIQVWFWAALAGHCRAAVILLLPLALGLLLRRRATAGPTPGGRRAWLWPGFFAVLALLPLPLALLPELNFDALRVHLWIARELALTGAMPSDLSNWAVYVPETAGVWFGAAFLAGGEIAAKLAEYALGLLAGLLLARWGNERLGRPWGWAAGTLFIGLPVVAWLMGTAYMDLALVLFLLACLVCLDEWSRSGRAGWLAAAGLLFGCSLASKYHALVWALFLAGAVLALGRRRDLPWLRCLGAAALVLGLGAALLAPWLARNWALTGNPVFPVPLPGFQSPYMNSAIVEAIRSEQHSFGFGRGWLALLALPWNLTVHPAAFRGSPGGLVFLALPWLAWRWRRLSATDRLVAAGFVYWLLAWFFIAQEIRYLAPALPLAAWLAVRPHLPDLAGGRLARLGWGALLLAQLVLNLPPVHSRIFPNVAFQNRYDADTAAVLAGRLPRDEYRARRNPLFAVYRWADGHLQAPVRILSFDAAAYWTRWPMLYAFSVEGDFTGHAREPAAVRDYCRLAGLTHVTVNMDWVPPGADITKAPVFFDPAFQSHHLKEEYRYGNAYLFAIPPRGD